LDQQWKSGQTILTLENETLRVQGNGAMEDYRNCAFHASLAPWHGACSEGGDHRRTICNLPITNIVIEDGVTHIGKFAFCGLKRLKSVTIPASVTSIGVGAFYSCDSLTYIKVAEDNAYFASEDGIIFNKDKSILIRYPQGRSGAYMIPYGVTTIGATAFHGSVGLTSVTIPNTVTTIEPGVFEPWSVDHLDKSVVSLAKTIKNDIRKGLVFGAFGNCTGLESITIPGSVISIGEWAFAGCTGLTSITIEEGVKSIDRFAFFGCTGLTSITIPSSMTFISNGAFISYTGLTSITVTGDNVHYSSVDGVLFNKAKDTLIHYPRERVGAYYTIPSNVISIADRAFFANANLTSMTIPNSVKSIDRWAFAHSSLTSVTIPGSVISIGEGAFYECANLTSVTLGSGILLLSRNIFPHAFLLCSNLSSMTIPSDVTTIKMKMSNRRLTSIISLNPVPPDIQNTQFSPPSLDACLYVLEGSIDAYRAAEGWNHFNCIKGLESIPKGE
jgi:hypothetical protein